MAEGFDGEQVDLISEFLSRELCFKERGCGAHGVDEHKGRFARVDARARDTIAGIDASEVGNLDSRFGSHSCKKMISYGTVLLFLV
jgi:hypothetical protein